MKKERIVALILIVVIAVSYILPIETKAKTISQFEAEADKLTKELEEKKSKLAKNDQEISEIRVKIKDIEAQISSAEEEINSLQAEIDKSNEEIKAKSEESKKIMEYYQISNGENTYLEYAFGATSITDMIYRMSIVEQLTEYNDKIMKELGDLIAENKLKQKSLNSKKAELSQLQKDLQSEKERIEDDSASIRVGMPTIEEQLKAAKSNVSYYKGLGCGATEDIQACQYRIMQSQGSSGGGGSVPSANGYFRPMQFGYLVRGMSSSHIGYDLSSSDKAITIYPIATGQLYFAGFDKAGAYIVILRHNVGGKYIYATYAHMRSFSSAVSGYVDYTKGTSSSIKNGPILSPDTPIGNMGSTGNSTGPHLHIEISTCSWHKEGGCLGYSAYVNRIGDVGDYVNIPSKWTNR